VNDDKSEGRNPKPERSPKPGIRNRRAADAVFFGLRNSDFFRISDFGFRILLMLLARVEGNVVATRKHPSYEGWRLVICQPMSTKGEPEGSPTVAIDAHGAGMHQQVIISSDGLAARKAVGDDKSPVRWMVIAVVDEKEPGVRV
jgi:ethanolamine utilization protein EutN